MLGLLAVIAGAVALFRSLPRGDVDPFGALMGGLGALLAGLGLVFTVLQYRRERESGAEGTLAKAVRRHEQSQYDNVLGPSRVVMPVRFRFTSPPGGPEGRPESVSEAEWEDVADLYLALPDSGGRRLVVTGGPGGGKSLLAKALTLQLAARHVEGACGVPVLLPLWSWTGHPKGVRPADEGLHRAFRSWLVEQVSGTYGRSPALVERVIDDAVLVLDGLDEMDGREDTARPRARALLTYLRDNRRRPGTWSSPAGQARTRAWSPRSRSQERPGPSSSTCRPRRPCRTSGGRARGWMAAAPTAGPPAGGDPRIPEGPLARELHTPWRLTLVAHAYRAGTDEGPGITGTPPSWCPGGAVRRCCNASRRVPRTGCRRGGGA
ncbi:NACHT domain-containing protein [Streptomyces sp. C8S0]|uniref:NACHT domain-containing protein n=1 Tax=Streptomyces sp. C8S0 TaxID=2585716 RepID=UPI00125E0A1F|nr:NACHT domain-containing protein [Streptomyces sp. C8S0]